METKHDNKMTGSVVSEADLEVSSQPTSFRVNDQLSDSLCCFRRKEGTLPQPRLTLVTVLSLLFLGFAIALTSLGVSVHMYLANNTHSSPALWWIGVGPAALGCVGILAALSRSITRVSCWGLNCAVVLVTETCVMGALGAFSPALYNVWPPIQHYQGHPLCVIMVESCYCQDSFHGRHSGAEQPHTQYIHMDVVWKDSGFSDCDDVRHISTLYYVTMAMYGACMALTLASAVISANMTLVMRKKVPFQLLEEDTEQTEENSEEEDHGLEQGGHGEGKREDNMHITWQQRGMRF